MQQIGRFQSPKELVTKYDGCWITKREKIYFKLQQRL